jgi:HTH-type transcriptional regulator/antitoxin MqsA
MKKKSSYDYGQCHVCGERMEERRVKQDFWIKDELIVVEGVPAGVCPRCGEKVVRAEVGRQLAALLGNPDLLRRTQTMSVPVIPFKKAAA